MAEYREIQVYTKDGVHIADFTNMSLSLTQDIEKNKLYNPMVHIVQNGESTLTYTMFKDSEKWATVKAPENRWHCNGRVYVGVNENNYSYNGDLVTVTLVEEWYLLSRQYGQVQNVDTSVEAIDDHTIKILPKSDTSNKLTVNGVEYEESAVKDSTGTVQPRGSAGYALWGVVKANTLGWTLGVVDVLADGFSAEDDYGVFNLETDMKDLLHNIKYVQELWGGVLVWDSLNKTVSLRDEDKEETDFNTWTGFEAKEGKNLLSAPVITQDNNLITKAYILGNGNLNIKAVNDDKSYVEDYSYTDEVYEGYLQNANIYYTGSEDTSGQTQLLAWGEKEIAKYSSPRVQYSLSIFDRRYLDGYEHEVFDIDDVIHVIVKNELTGEEEVVEQRVIEWQYDFFDAKNSSVTVGDKVLNFIDLFKLTYNNATESPSYDWSGMFNGVDILIDIPDDWLDFFGGSYSMSLSNVTQLYARKATENTEAIAQVYVYADETFATAVMVSTLDTRITDAETNITTTTNALAAFQTTVSNTYATTSQLSSYATTTYVNGQVATLNTSIAEVQTWTSSNFASISLTATVTALNTTTNSLQTTVSTITTYASFSSTSIVLNATAGSRSYLTLTSSSGGGAVAILAIASGPSITLSSTGSIAIGSSSNTVTLMGKTLSFTSSGYLIGS